MGARWVRRVLGVSLEELHWQEKREWLGRRASLVCLASPAGMGCPDCLVGRVKQDLGGTVRLERRETEDNLGREDSLGRVVTRAVRVSLASPDPRDRLDPRETQDLEDCQG